MSTFLSKNKTLFHLLSLYCHKKNGTFNQQQLAALLHISTKQLNRYLKLFQQHNWLSYQAGNGRGHLSKIQWHHDIEKMIVDAMKPHISVMTMMDWEELFAFPHITDSLAISLKQLYQQNITNNIVYNERLIVPIYHPIYNLQPDQVNDAYSAALLSNITNRLVEADTVGTIIPSLAHHWKMNDQKLRLYLRKNVTFHNGDLLTAKDVVWCLRQLLHLPLWKPIQEIKIVDMWTIDIILSESCTYVLYLLTDIQSSIYKTVDTIIYGTGSFAISTYTTNQIVLKAYDNYFGMQALLQTVELNLLPKSLNSFFQTNFSTSIHHKKMNIQNGICAIILNKNTEVCSTKIKRQHIKNIIHKHLYTFLQSNPSLKNHLRDFNSSIPPLGTNENFKIAVSKGKSNLNQHLVSAFKQYGYQPQVDTLTLSQYIKYSLQQLHHDVLVYTNVISIPTAFNKLQAMFSPDSPIYKVCKDDIYFNNLLNQFKCTSKSEWPLLYDALYDYLMEEAILIPLFTHLDDIPFAHDILELSFNYLGYIDFSTIWYDEEEFL